MDGCLRISGLAEYLDTPVAFVRTQVRARRWPHYVIKDQVRFSPADVAEILAMTEIPRLDIVQAPDDQTDAEGDPDGQPEVDLRGLEDRAG